MQSAPFQIVVTTDHPNAQCVDLRATFGRLFRFVMDEAYAAERPEFRTKETAWLTVIPCRFGRIYPQGGRRLAASSASSPRRRRALEAIPGVTVIQGGGPCSRDVTVVFDAADIEPVARLFGARRPRRLSPGTVERLRALSRHFGFGRRLHRRETESHGQEPRLARGLAQNAEASDPSVLESR